MKSPNARVVHFGAIVPESKRSAWHQIAPQNQAQKMSTTPDAAKPASSEVVEASVNPSGTSNVGDARIASNRAKYQRCSEALVSHLLQVLSFASSGMYTPPTTDRA